MHFEEAPFEFWIRLYEDENDGDVSSDVILNSLKKFGISSEVKEERWDENKLTFVVKISDKDKAIEFFN